MFKAVLASIVLCVAGCRDGAGNSEATRAPAEEDSPHPLLLARLDGIVVPQVRIEEALITEAIEFASLCIRQHDPNPELEMRGISILLKGHWSQNDPTAGERDAARTGAAEPTMSYSAENVAIIELLKEIARQGGYQLYLTSSGIVFVAAGEQPFPNSKAESGSAWRIPLDPDIEPAH